jgi:hypothetical protein
LGETKTVFTLRPAEIAKEKIIDTRHIIDVHTSTFAERVMETIRLNLVGRLFFTFAFLMIFASTVSALSMFDKVNDFDGDGRADFVVTRAVGGLKVWYVWQTTAGFMTVQWGVAGDNNASGDFDGDGKTDFAISRSIKLGTRDTYILYLQTNTYSVKRLTSIFAFFTGPQDYDGDGKADPAVTFIEGTTVIIYHSSIRGVQEGTDMPAALPERVGDLTGDGRAEAAVSSGGTDSSGRVWIRNLATDSISSVAWGLQGDQFVAADFDGDDKGDIAIFRPSTGDWWWIRSSDSVVNVVHWGLNGDVPVAADYDGDSKTDHAIYRPGSPNGIYWILNSSGGVTGARLGRTWRHRRAILRSRNLVYQSLELDGTDQAVRPAG